MAFGGCLLATSSRAFASIPTPIVFIGAHVLGRSGHDLIPRPD